VALELTTQGLYILIKGLDFQVADEV